MPIERMPTPNDEIARNAGDADSTGRKTQTAKAGRARTKLRAKPSRSAASPQSSGPIIAPNPSSTQ